ncbi:hypothetical protein L1987_29883 [Smallanthus sonchifolius]|uniref:Uncharacterized protein n=1 Tax=Smallanthus sonchifolius TaxID=185202 RepID=A0ACB9I1B4_9ASTR|nr:hypothetical protein L1987_29883 [Smallanthus sonchifolius]
MLQTDLVEIGPDRRRDALKALVWVVPFHFKDVEMPIRVLLPQNDETDLAHNVEIFGRWTFWSSVFLILHTLTARFRFIL